jgi:hypothetical protein
MPPYMLNRPTYMKVCVHANIHMSSYLFDRDGRSFAWCSFGEIIVRHLRNFLEFLPSGSVFLAAISIIRRFWRCLVAHNGRPTAILNIYYIYAGLPLSITEIPRTSHKIPKIGQRCTQKSQVTEKEKLWWYLNLCVLTIKNAELRTGKGGGFQLVRRNRRLTLNWQITTFTSYNKK